MGIFFENIHIHKKIKFDVEVLKKELIKYFEEKGFKLTAEGEDGSASVVIYEPEGSNWVSVASDIFQLETLDEIRSGCWITFQMLRNRGFNSRML